MDREEPVRAEERPARARRRQPARIQLAARRRTGSRFCFTVRNQDGGAPWSVVEDVTFPNNLVRHVAAGINMLGHDDIHPSQQARRIAIRNNLFVDVGGPWGSGRLFQLLDGTSDVTIRSQHGVQDRQRAVRRRPRAPHRVRLPEQRRAAQRDRHRGSGTASGRESLDRYFPGASVRRNVIIGGNPARYPSGNFFPASLDAAATFAATGGSQPLATAVCAQGDRRRDVGADIERSQGARRHPRRLPAAARRRGRRDDRGFGGEPAGTGVRRRVLGLAVPARLRLRRLSARRLAAGARCRPQSATAAQPIEPTVSIVRHRRTTRRRASGRASRTCWRSTTRATGSDRRRLRRIDRRHRGARAPLRARRRAGAWRSASTGAASRRCSTRSSPRSRRDRALRRCAADVRATRPARAGGELCRPAVGAVSGELMLTDSTGTPHGPRRRRSTGATRSSSACTEGRADSTVGATGAIYAIRRALFEPIPGRHDSRRRADSDADRPAGIPGAVRARGPRLSRRVAHDASRSSCARCGRSPATFQLFVARGVAAQSVQNALWFETVSHKGLRLLLPVFHLALFAANLELSRVPFYGAVLRCRSPSTPPRSRGHELRHAARRPIYISVPCAMCCMLWATVAAFHRFLTDATAGDMGAGTALDFPDQGRARVTAVSVAPRS